MAGSGSFVAWHAAWLVLIQLFREVCFGGSQIRGILLSRDPVNHRENGGKGPLGW